MARRNADGSTGPPQREKRRLSSLRFGVFAMGGHGFDPEESQERFALRDLAVRAQLIVIRQQRRLAAMFDDDDPVFGDQIVFRDLPHDGRVKGRVVRRIEVDDVEPRLFGREVFQRPNHVAIDHLIIFSSYPAIPQVLADDSRGFERRFDERDGSRAARQRLDADRARPRADIGETRPFDSRRENVEKRLARTIRSRTHAQSFERFQATTFIDTGNDSHKRWEWGSGEWEVGNSLPTPTPHSPLPNPYSSYPFGCARRQRQEDSMMLSSSLWRGVQPRSRMILSGLAISTGGSPARRGAASVEIQRLVTWRAISTTSATE